MAKRRKRKVEADPETMVRVNFYVTRFQKMMMKKIQRRTGVSESQQLRDGLDLYIRKHIGRSG